MEREDLELIVALTETRTVTGAGVQLGLKQPVVTRRVQSLEKKLGTTLLSRRTRPAEPTSDCIRIYKQAKRLLRQLNELTAWLQTDAVISGELRFGTALSLGDDMLEHPLERLRKDFPHLSVQLVLSHRNQTMTSLKGWDTGVLMLLLS